MQVIHHTHIEKTMRWTLDPDRGAVKEPVAVLKRSNVDRIVHDGETYEIHGDGSFYVPDHVAAFLLRMPDWHEGESPFPPDDVAPSPSELQPPRVTQRQHAHA